MHIHLYVDCEFTSLERPKLISFAAVTDDSRECYIEVDLEGRRGKDLGSESSTFVIDTVLPQLRRYPTAIVPADQVGDRLADWLLELGADTIYVTYDYSTDFDLIERALRDAGRWDELAEVLQPTHVAYLLGQPEVEGAMERSWAQSFVDGGLERHHALADARALRAGFHAAQGSPASNDDVASFDAEGIVGDRDTVAISELDPKIVAINSDEAQLLEGTVARWNLLAADGIDDALPASVRHDAPVVFLDIDDVICLSEQYGGHDAVDAVKGRHSHPDRVFSALLHLPALRVLEALHKELAGQPRFVITSTWRLYLNRSQLVEVLQRSGLAFIAERIERKDRWATIDLPKRTRLSEIRNWLDHHAQGEPFVVIDDTFSGMSLIEARDDPHSPFRGRIVFCNEGVGLVPEHLPALLKALRTKP